MTRNKRINEYIEQSEVSKGYITKRVIQNPHFTICNIETYFSCFYL